MSSTIAHKRLAKEAWDAIAASRVGSKRTRKHTQQKLRQEWDRLAFRLGKVVDDFVLRMTTLVQQIAQYGNNEMLLRVIPKKYMEIALSIETLLDLSQLTIEEVIGRLKAIDDRNKVPEGPISVGGKLFYAEEH